MATENLAPQVITRLLGEIRQLVKNPPEGIEYVQNEDCVASEIHASIAGPEGTPFLGGNFRLKLVISEDYPNTPPKGYFLTKIFHPNVANNGDICVNTLKKDWSSEVTLSHVLQVIRCLLIVPFPESSLNDEAGKLFMESYDEYAARARILTEVHALPEGKGKSSSDLVVEVSSNKQSAAKKKEKEAKKKCFKRL
ncbi:putative ubiquitin protein ligase [Ochromonadaceae sp. CCMP2298]|nr:putative ubiquitin protein ligase [Ochromonadaceae sp. CCMP2298]|mmetsp:Transcript_12643/g.28354  ORF Transcript_12643/g.28354 Transcript_12643/m.28354 type:complete len:195 (+) Transcript_12643:1427-2011(+)